MTGLDLLYAALALLFVVGLIGGLAILLRSSATLQDRLRHWGSGTNGRSKRRLELVETLALDARRRLVLVRCDDRDHLLLLGGHTDQVVAADTAPKETAHDRDRRAGR
ncbi:hypothetical protein CCR85_03175 [Rhodothalassium salexigens]|uniref:flagellar biosynthetic protein FliO n=1 Tax=Rhodothalassium salexigens TaxID=1086 RepID=UPI0019116555|nr:flagellar biosynthetic protein FliO [Rhodothalassium salexigens]MBK5910494.1 hypothetical protein [Rhodothalassium salexigens]MBK5921688.1 hypothetical protein [Rhodothalassium salexigens]